MVSPIVSAASRSFVSVREVADSTGLHPHTIHRRIKDGTLASIKIGRRRLLPVDAIEQLLKVAG